MLKIAFGTVPVRLFIPKSRNFKAFKLPNEVGMEPTRLFVISVAHIHGKTPRETIIEETNVEQRRYIENGGWYGTC